MSYLRLTLIVAGLFVMSCGESACGGEYSDPSGFSFSYPEGWLPVNAATLAKGQDTLPPELKNWLAKNNIDFNRISVALLRKGDGDFLENLNVVVDKQQIPATDATATKLAEILPAKFAAMGAKLENVQSRVEKVGSRDAVVVDYDTQLPGVPFRLRQRQIMFPGGGNSYIVTCTAKADAFERHLPAFEKILASFQVPAPTSSAPGFDWTRVLIMGAAGAAIGGIVGAIKWLTGKRTPKQESAG